MATKKKVDDEAGDAAEVVDTEAVETADADAPAEVEESTPVEEPVEENPDTSGKSDDVFGTAQDILGVARTGSMNHGTKMALRALQRKAGIPQTGQLDTRTRGVMHL